MNLNFPVKHRGDRVEVSENDWKGIVTLLEILGVRVHEAPEPQVHWSAYAILTFVFLLLCGMLVRAVL